MNRDRAVSAPFAIVFVLLTNYLQSFSLALQVMLNLPLAIAGALVFTWWKIDHISIATLAGSSQSEGLQRETAS